MEVAMLDFDLAANYVVFVLDDHMVVLGNEGGDPHHTQGHHTQDLGIGL
jgi:hypothetical protein